MRGRGGMDGDIGVAARRARKGLLLSQEQVADAAGVSVSSVARLERGDGVSDETLKAVCAVVGLDAAALRGAELVSPDPLPAARGPDRPSGRRRALRLAAAWALACVPLSLIGVELGVQASILGSAPQREGVTEMLQQSAVRLRVAEINKAAVAYSSILPADAPDRGWQPWKQGYQVQWSICGRQQSGIVAVATTWDLANLNGVPVCSERGIPSIVVRRDDASTEFVLGPLEPKLARGLLALLTPDPSVSVQAIATATSDMPGPEPAWSDPRLGPAPLPVEPEGFLRIRLGRAS